MFQKVEFQKIKKATQMTFPKFEHRRIAKEKA